MEGGKTVNDTPSQQTKRHDSLVWVQWAHFSQLGWANVEIMGSSLNISYLGPIFFIYCPKCPLYDNPQQCQINWISQRLNLNNLAKGPSFYKMAIWHFFFFFKFILSYPILSIYFLCYLPKRTKKIKVSKFLIVFELYKT